MQIKYSFDFFIREISVELLGGESTFRTEIENPACLSLSNANCSKRSKRSYLCSSIKHNVLRKDTDLPRSANMDFSDC